MRRTLVLAAAIAASTLLLACGGGDDDDNGDASGTPDSFPTTNDPARNIPEELRNKINIVIAGSDWFVGENNFVFGITDLNDQPQGGAEAVATFYDIRDQANPVPFVTVPAVQSAPGVGEIIEHEHAGGEVHLHGGQDDNRVGYYVTVDFPHPGPWGVAIEATLKDGTKGITSVGFLVFEAPNMPAPGEAAYLSDNLTKDDVEDISEIDSGVPPNDMHDIKIKDAIEAGRPLVIVFSTPAFCTSRFCGPVNEEVEALHDQFKDDVDFVHIEVWRNFNRQQMNPTAREWLIWPDGSLREPIVYVVDSEGTIFDRWEGPVAANIMEASVQAVAKGATYE